MILTGHILNICLIACPWLFIASAIIEGSEAIYEYVATIYKPLNTNDWNNDKDQILINNQYNLLRKQRLCHLIAALLLLACVVCWNLFPASLVLSLACVLFIVLVVVTREYIKAQLSKSAGIELQSNLKILTATGNHQSTDETHKEQAGQQGIIFESSLTLKPCF